MPETIRLGGCGCGRVRYSLAGEPVRIGICHCTLCRRESGSMFTTFGVWNRSQFASTGEFGTWEGRSFCTNCGSRLFALTDREAEVKLGTLDDAPTGLSPRYELWIGRREPWLVPVDGASQHIGDRHR